MSKINTENINYNNIQPCVFGPSYGAGVYAVCAKSTPNHDERILYIGSSKNIKARVLRESHPYIKLINKGLHVYLKCIDTDNYIELEKKLINQYKPLLNKQHKNG